MVPHLFYISEEWMEWVTYTFCQFHLRHRGSRVRHRRARPLGRRFAGHDSETPLRHTRWLLDVTRKGWRKEKEEMQHEVMEVNKWIACFTRKHEHERECEWRGSGCHLGHMQ